jgi:hypothetical protein
MPASRRNLFQNFGMKNRTHFYEAFLEKLDNVQGSGMSRSASCPAHDDAHNSLSIGQGDDGRILLKCFAGCSFEEILEALRIEARDLFYVEEQRRRKGCTLAEYAAAKKLPVAFLKDLGVGQINYGGRPAVRIPYRHRDGHERAIRFRLSLTGDDRFRWRKGSKPLPYGLDRLPEYQASDHVFLVEGESDAQTLWLANRPALGVPGALTWRSEWEQCVAAFGKIYLVAEPDEGGESLLERLRKSTIINQVWVIRMSAEPKDASGLYLQDPDKFESSLDRLMAKAIPLQRLQDERTAKVRGDLEGQCGDIIHSPNVLEVFSGQIKPLIAGALNLALVTYLVLVSRLLEKPVSLGVKGPSAAGKSYLVDQVLRFFPNEAYYRLTAMSERALAYTEKDLRHVTLVLAEVAGIKSSFQAYLIRSLLSEGNLQYETVEKTDQGLRSRLILKEGPTNLIVTTTRAKLHDENETRLFSITVSDQAAQTREIMMTQARLASGRCDDLDLGLLGRWQAFQRWLALSGRSVVLPFSEVLAAMVSPRAVRLRRDFQALLSLIKAHALLHQATREIDERGRIIATTEDYRAVHALVAEVINENVEAAVPPTVREIIQRVRELSKGKYQDGVPYSPLSGALGIDKSSVSRRAKVAMELGYLANKEIRPGHPARLSVVSEPSEFEYLILPDPKPLEEAVKGQRKARLTPVETFRRVTPDGRQRSGGRK